MWTWGARGQPCLGHYDAALEGPWKDRVGNIFSVSTELTKAMVPFEMVAWCKRWARPRRIEGAEELQVESVAAGDMHTALLSSTGKLFLCGTGKYIVDFSNIFIMLFQYALKSLHIAS